MAGVKGRSGTNKGKDKPFADALRMEIAAAGDNHKALRAIARNLIALAQVEDKDALPAIMQIADRLDGKPAQESTVTMQHRVDELSDDELAREIAELRASAVGPSNGNGSAPPDTTLLN